MKQLRFILSIYKLFKSIKLALVLIGYLVATSILASFIPQGKQVSYYAHEFPSFIYRIIMELGIDNFFRSFLFIIPLGIFFLNLSVCTIDRIITRIRHRALVRPGPDIIHLGLLILMIAGVITLFERREGFIYLAPGDTVDLPNGYTLALKSFAFASYTDGRPKKWTSEVVLTRKGKEKNVHSIEVNKPLKTGAYNIFQYSYKDLSTVTLTDTSGNITSLYPGETLTSGNSVFKFVRVSTDPSGLITVVKETGSSESESNDLLAVFLEMQGKNKGTYKLLKTGKTIGSFTVSDLYPHLETGLNVVDDPGFMPVIIALILIGLGLSVTLIQKRGDTKI